LQSTLGGRRFVVMLLFAAGLVVPLVTAPAAGAHATLKSTSPVAGAVLDKAPDRVLLRFSEPIETSLGAIQVLGPDGRRVDAGDLLRPSPQEAGIRLAGDLPKGSYTVAYRIVSADTHPVSGAVVFSVGAPSGSGVAKPVFDDAPRSTDIVFGIVRGLAIGLLLLCAGGSLVLALGIVPAPSAVRMWQAVGGLAVLLGGVSAAGLVPQASTIAGVSLVDAVDGTLLRGVADTSFGTAWLARAGIAFVLAVVALAIVPRWRRLGVGLALLLSAGLVIAQTTAGHSATRGTLGQVLDIVHVTAASAWTGGLAVVVAGVAVAGSRRWQVASHALPRFSALALASVAVLVLAGVANGLLELDGLRGLVDTTYGRLLLVKAGLVAGLVGLGAVNRGSIGGLRGDDTTPSLRSRFARTLGAELAVMAVVVGVTAALVAEPPTVAARTGPFEQQTTLGPLGLDVIVDPAKPGRNTIHLTLTDRVGRPTKVDELRVSATQVERGVGPLHLTTTPAGPGHYIVAGAALPLSGDWQLRIEARRGEFELLTAKLTIPLGDTP
jgi:copper transport protein